MENKSNKPMYYETYELEAELVEMINTLKEMQKLQESLIGMRRGDKFDVDIIINPNWDSHTFSNLYNKEAVHSLLEQELNARKKKVEDFLNQNIGVDLACLPT